MSDNVNTSNSKYWCFTLNNYTPEEEQHIHNMEFTYMICARERGEQGTPHLQGYVEFESKAKFETVKRRFGTRRIHLELRAPKSNSKAASDYCRKEDPAPFEEGVLSMSKQGKRSDLDEVREAVAAGKGMRDIIPTVRSFQAAKFGELALRYMEATRNWKPHVVWMWGPTGIGKTSAAFRLLPNAWMKNTADNWWDGYDGQEEVILDDFRDNWFPMTTLLGVLDRYACRVQNKGGSRSFLAKKIVVTSITPPDEVYRVTFGAEPIQQLLRRIDQIIGPDEVQPHAQPTWEDSVVVDRHTANAPALTDADLDDTTEDLA